MKTPLNAYFIELGVHPRLPAVTIRPCIVTATFEGTKQAVIEVHSLMVSGRQSRMVPFAALASTLHLACEKAADLIAGLPQLEISAPNEKAAAAEVAGVGVESKGDAA